MNIKEEMDFFSPPSLLFSSSVAVTASLFYHENLEGIKERQEHRCGWIDVQNRVADNIKHLPLPPFLMPRVLFLVQPLGDQIRKWISKHNAIDFGCESFHPHLRWDTHGLIDYPRTAGSILKGCGMRPVAAFKLACVDCQEGHLRKVWPEVREVVVPAFSRLLKTRIRSDPVIDEAVLVWAALLSGQTDQYVRARADPADLSPDRHNFDYVALQVAVETGNISMVRFFLARFGADVRSRVAVQFASRALRTSRSYSTPVLLHLVSRMEPPALEVFFSENLEFALYRFLEFPLYKYFLAAAKERLGNLSERKFFSMAESVVIKIKQQDTVPESISFATPQVYEAIFYELWEISPAERKRTFIERQFFQILSTVFDMFYSDGLKILFPDAKITEKLIALFFSDPSALLHLLLTENKAKGFKSLILKYLPNEPLVKDFEKVYENLTMKYQDRYYGVVLLD